MAYTTRARTPYKGCCCLPPAPHSTHVTKEDFEMFFPNDLEMGQRAFAVFDINRDGQVRPVRTWPRRVYMTYAIM